MITQHHGDNLDILPTLAPCSVQAIITSPAYFGLRVYQIPKSSWPEIAYCPLIGLPPVVIPAMQCQLGAEPDPLAYIGHLVHVFRLARPALRGDATLWVNLADSYAGSWGNYGRKDEPGTQRERSQERDNEPSAYKGNREKPITASLNIPEKNLLGIPHRAALALQADGWVWRSEVIWHAPNKMPESVRDRPTRAHEQILLFGNGPRYYYDQEAVAEQAIQPIGEARLSGQHRQAALQDLKSSTLGSNQGAPTRNRRSVWSIPTTPMPAALRGDDAHYAAWPPALVEIMVKASTANKACAACGAAWVRQVEREAQYERRQDRAQPADAMPQVDSSGWKPAIVRDLGFTPACACEAGVGRCVVLDCFGGTGTTAQVAEQLGRDAILIDLGYQALQSKRTDNVQIAMEAYL